MSSLVEELCASVLSEGTIANQRATFARLDRWRAAKNIGPMPMTEAEILQYFFSRREDWSFGYVRASMVHIRRTYLERGWADPFTHISEAYRATLRRDLGEVKEPSIDALRVGDLHMIANTYTEDVSSDPGLVRLRAAVSLCVLAGLALTAPGRRNGSIVAVTRLPADAFTVRAESILVAVPGREPFILTGDRWPHAFKALRQALTMTAHPQPLRCTGNERGQLSRALIRAGHDADLHDPTTFSALGEDELYWLLQSLDPGTRKRLRDLAYLTVGVHLARRHQDMSEITLDGVEPTAAGFRVFQARSKTDPEAVGVVMELCHSLPGSTCTDSAPCAPACPVLALHRYLDFERFTRNRTAGPLFVSTRKDCAKPMTRSNGMWIVADAFARAGRPDAHVGTRALRAGGATSASEAGASIADIAALTGHTSPVMARRYVRRISPWGSHLVLEP
jgi:hypothetical protein